MKLWTVLGLCLTIWFNLGDAMMTVCYPEHVQAKFCNADFVIRAKIISTVKTDIPDLPTPPRNQGNGRGHGKNNKDNNSKDSFKVIIPKRGRYSAPDPRRFARSLGIAPAGAGFGLARRFPQYLDVKIKRILKGADLVSKAEGTTPMDNSTRARYYSRVYVMDPFVGRKLKPNQAYLLAGKIMKNKLWLSSCSWHAEWKQVGLDQLHSLKKDYIKGCLAQCRIQTCFYQGCENSKYSRQRVDMCMWKPDDWSPVYGTNNDCKTKHSVCRKINGRCQWKHSERFLKCKISKSKSLP